MAKFLNKKEQVFDIQLTPFGKHSLSIGSFKPVYYAFYDDNILYDGAYAGLTEGQNQIQTRIKEETQYIEGLSRFTDAEDEPFTGTSGATVEFTDSSGDPIERDIPYYEIDLTASLNEPTKTVLKYEIGDAFLEGDRQAAPAWKIVSLEGRVTGTSQKDLLNDLDVPQVNVSLSYNLKIHEADPYGTFFAKNIEHFIATSDIFADNKVIRLHSDDFMMYGEEMNTELLTENFDVEVFEVLIGSVPAKVSGDPATDSFVKKLFLRETGRLQDGMYHPVDPIALSKVDYNTNSVKYYFDVLVDEEVDKITACKSAAIFNKDSYYIDLDFDCDDVMPAGQPFDIYGVVTEPEICQ